MGNPSQNYGVSFAIMGSHSVTRHLTIVNASRLNTRETGRHSIYLPQTDRELSWAWC